MSNRVKFIFFAALLFSASIAAAGQVLKPGFDADEYTDVLLRCAGGVNFFLRGDIPKELNYKSVYSSPEMGMHNKYQIWLSNDKSVMAINLRGTTGDIDSWIENFYSAMIPATGTLKLSSKYTFNYKFANDPKAMVHVGWAIGVASLLPDILDKIQLFYRQGTKQIIVEGHSQGGALAFLLSSYLHYQVADGKLPSDLVIKTYCSAAPKPGNLYYAYDFDFINKGGWAFTVVNAADWVPEMPVTIQTKNDVNLNPFGMTRRKFKNQKFFVRLYLSHIYNQLDHSTRKAQRKYEKYLGRKIYKQVKKYVPEYEQPLYTGCSNYMRAGNPVVLEPDAEYYKLFPDTGANIFRNHLFKPYLYLVKKEYK